MVSGKLLVVLGATLATSVDGASAHKFYKGKTITYVVATSPGGTFDNCPSSEHLAQNGPWISGVSVSSWG